MIVAIIGAGEIGRALGQIIGERAEVRYWDKAPAKLAGLPGENLSLPEILAGAEVIFLCLPSWSLPEALFCLSPYLRSGQTIITLSKGLEDRSGKTAVEFVSKLARKCAVGALGGPMIAEELSAGRAGFGVLAGADKKVFTAGELFADSQLAIATSKDVLGVSLGGVLKNIYAMGAGIAGAREWGSNARAQYLTVAANEILAIGKILGGKAETLLGPAGLGDFLATALSPDSINYQVGQALARGEELSQPSEGLVSLSLLFERLDPNKTKNFPLLLALKKIVVEKKPSAEIFREMKFS